MVSWPASTTRRGWWPEAASEWGHAHRADQKRIVHTNQNREPGQQTVHYVRTAQQVKGKCQNAVAKSNGGEKRQREAHCSHSVQMIHVNQPRGYDGVHQKSENEEPYIQRTFSKQTGRPNVEKQRTDTPRTKSNRKVNASGSGGHPPRSGGGTKYVS